MTESRLAKKLQMKPGQRVAVFNPPEGFVLSLAPLPEGAKIVEVEGKTAGELDFVQLFVQNTRELERLFPEAHRALKYDGVLWIAYPKKSSKVATDLSRDKGWKFVTEAGLRPVRQVAVDEVWSALRFRPVERVAGKGSRG